MKNKPFAVFDLETDPFLHGRIPQVFAAGFYDGQTNQVKWGTQKQCLDWLCEKLRNFSGICYAHNGGKFDTLGYVVPHDFENFVHESPIMRGNRMVSVKYVSCEIRDSYAILPAPLRSHDKGEIDYQLFEAKKRDKYKDQILEYLKRDLTSLYAWIEKFRAEHGDALTAAQAAMRSMHSICDVKTPKFSSALDERMRKFYYGGRCQVFQPGVFSGDYYYADINSAYPYAMTFEHAFTTEFDVHCDSKLVTQQSFVVVEGLARGCFCVVNDEGRNTYPLTTGKFYVTGWEYLTAMKLGLFQGKILMVYSPAENGIMSFRPFVQHWHDEKTAGKKAGDKSRELVAKITMNSCYGKFAQRPEHAEELMFAPADESPLNFDGGWIEKMNDGAVAVWSRKSDRLINPWNVATGASITGFCRSLIMRAKHACPGALYTDTDSLIVPANEIDRLDVGTGLGRWEIKFKSSGKNCVAIAGKKLYAFRDEKKGWQTASKGAGLNAEQIIRVAQGETIEWKNDAPTFSMKSQPRFVVKNITKTI